MSGYIVGSWKINNCHKVSEDRKENGAILIESKFYSRIPGYASEGSMLGHRSQIAFNPSLKPGWVILANTTDFDFSRINDYITPLVLAYFNKIPATDLSDYTGTYLLQGGYDSLQIYSEDGALYSTYLAKDLPKLPLISAGYNKFKGQGKGKYPIAYDLINNKNSEIQYLNMGQLMWIKQIERN